MKSPLRLLLAGVLVFALFSATPGGITGIAAQQAVATGATKVNELLTQSGYEIKRASENVWLIPFKGESLKEFTVILSTSGDGNLLVVFVVVAEKKNIKGTADLWLRMLRFNDELDRVKVGVDGDADAFVRIDLATRTLDLDELKANIHQVAAAADEVHAAIEPYLAAPAPSNP